MKKVSVVWQVMSVLILCSLILMSIVFGFEMKNWGFSQYELAVLFIILVVICYWLGFLTLGRNRETMTLVYLSILMVLLMALEVCCMTVLKEVIQTFFFL